MIKATSDILQDSWTRRRRWPDKDRYETAMDQDDCYESDLDANLSEPESLMTRAKALSDMGRYEEAAALYDRAIDVTPIGFTDDIAIASAEKGKAMERAGMHLQAQEALKRSLELKAEDRVARHYKDLARICERKDQI